MGRFLSLVLCYNNGHGSRFLSREAAGMQILDNRPQAITFEAAYQAANNAQRAAIDQTEGTLLVVAGPGTGKTQIIAARIAAILRRGCQAENILCLTYTDAGTIAMRNRLLAFIGADAYRVNIHTFHSFCNLVIQENPASFGFSNLQPVSELEQREIVKLLLDGLPYDNPLAREKGNLYRDARILLDLYATMKREDWGVNLLLENIDHYLAVLPEQPEMRYSRRYTNREGVTFQPGDLKQAKLDGEIRKFQRLRAAAETFLTYQALLQERQRYDFDDMLLWVIDAFKKDAPLLNDYQERFQYLLVDEYQDTSGSQNEIVDLLMDYWENPNLFVVGDDDQAIYRFQGANLENLLSFHERYAPQVVTLTENYRSSQEILTASRQLIAANRERLANPETAPGLVIDKQLVATQPAGELPEVRAYPNLAQESLGIARELEQLHRQGGDLSGVAVLYRNHRQVEMLSRYLAARGIPHNVRRRVDLLQTPLVSQLVSILRYLHGESQRPHGEERLLFRILHYPVFALTPLEVAQLVAPVPGEPWASRRPLRERLLQEGQPAKDALASRLLEESLSDIPLVTLQELVQRVINRFGLLCQSGAAETILWNLEQLNTFFDFVKDECARNPRLDLAGLVAMLDLMAEQGLQLPAERVACHQGGVNLVTCHSAKGLEFATVYLLGCTESEWEGKRTSAGFVAPPYLLRRRSDDTTSLEESRRLFFVALTRAERRLVVSYAEHDNADKPLAKSRFVAELEQGGAVSCRRHLLAAEELAEALQVALQEPPADSGSIYQADFVTELLKEYRLSASHLNSYLRCPHAFFYTNVLRVPEPRNAAMAFGTSVHEALEYLFTAMLASAEQAFPAKKAFLEVFSRELARRQDAFTPVAYERRLKSGLQSMEKLYDQYLDSWHKEVVLEKAFKVVLADGTPVNGRVDKLEKLPGGRVKLVDYKTGRFDGKKFQPPDPAAVTAAAAAGKVPAYEDRFGGDYWRQAVFYKIMVESSQEQSFQVAATEFCFVEPDGKSGAFPCQEVVIGPDAEAIVREQITTVYRRIMARDFAQRCDDPYCDWCRRGVAG